MTETMEVCPVCGHEAVVVREWRKVGIGKRVVEIHDERMRCHECGEEFFLPGQMQASHKRAIEQIRKEDGLLLPHQIRGIRENVDLTQAQFEQLLGVGPKTVVRWESGRVCQNKATDSLIRLVGANSENVRILAAMHAVVIPTQSAGIKAIGLVPMEPAPPLGIKLMVSRSSLPYGAPRIPTYVRPPAQKLEMYEAEIPEPTSMPQLSPIGGVVS